MLYPNISTIPPGTILTPDLLNRKYSTQITHIEWENLTQQVIAQRDLHNILSNGHDHLHPTLYYMKLGDPKHYYKSHPTQQLLVQYETSTVTPHLHILKETGLQLPNNLPQLHHHLIAIKTRQVNVCTLDPDTNRTITIPATQVLDHYLNNSRNGNTTTGLPFHSRGVHHPIAGDYKTISKSYRTSESCVSPQLLTKINELVNLDPNFQPTQFIDTINKLLIPTNVRNLIFKLYHTAAHIGTDGRAWQIHKAGMLKWIPQQVIPLHCLSPTCSHTMAFATPLHELFYCPMIKKFWTLTNNFLAMMQLPLRAHTINDILLLVSTHGSTTDILTLVNLHLILITLFALNSTYVYKMSLRQYNHPLDLQHKLIQKKAEKYYSTALIREIYALPYHLYNIRKHNLDKNGPTSNRDMSMYPQCTRNFNKPSAQLIDMYQTTWIKTTLVELKQNQTTQKRTLVVHKPIIPSHNPDPPIHNPQGVQFPILNQPP